MTSKQKIYLSGGLRTGWQQKVISTQIDDFVFYNPSEHGLLKSEQYTAWDLHYIRKCDIVFCYMEKSNPSGLGMALEVGYATALSKTIILVDEKSGCNKEFRQSFKIVRESADVTFKSFDKAIGYLKRFI